MNKLQLSLALLTCWGLVLASCGDKNGTSGSITKTVSSKEVALNNGILYLLIKPGPFTGLVNDLWPDGKNKYQCAYNGGIKDGSELAWHENGEKMLAAQFKNGVQEGQSQEWWSNGELRSTTPYSNGKPHGEVKGWHNNGKLARIERYEEGKKIGKSEGWWKTGKKADETHYINGLPTGKQVKWHPNGQKLSVKNYVKGMEQGPGTGWRSDGKLLWKGTWLDGKRQGLFVIYHTNGVRKLQMEYDTGILKRKSNFNLQGGITEDVITPPGRTVQWTKERLAKIVATKDQIKTSFGAPDKVERQAWIYSGIHLKNDKKLKLVTIRINFDSSGGNSQVIVQESAAKRPPASGLER